MTKDVTVIALFRSPITLHAIRQHIAPVKRTSLVNIGSAAMKHKGK
jgi:hypothetical protein